MTPPSDNANASTTMNPPPDRPQRTCAPETLLNQKKARDIIASGTLQRQPCTNYEKMKLDCFLDRSISNLCQYCVERKKVCSINPQGRRGITARNEAKRADEVQKEVAKDERPQPAAQSQDEIEPVTQPKPQPEIIDISLVAGQLSCTIYLPEGEYHTFQVVSNGMLETAVLLPIKPSLYGAQPPNDENGEPSIPTPIIRSVQPGRRESIKMFK